MFCSQIQTLFRFNKICTEETLHRIFHTTGLLMSEINSCPVHQARDTNLGITEPSSRIAELLHSVSVNLH